MSQKVLENDLLAIRKSKVTLKLNKPSYVGMCILHLSKVLMYENMLANQNYYSLILVV